MNKISWTLVFFATILFSCKENPSRKVSLEHAIASDSVNVKTDAAKFSMKSEMNQASFKELVKLKAKDSADTIIAKHKVIVDEFQGELTTRTNQIISNRRYFWEVQYAQPNQYKWALIIGIILVCGVLGGLAAPRYSLIKDLLKETTNAAGALNAKSNELSGMAIMALDGGDNQVTLNIEELKNANQELQAKLEQLKKELEKTPPEATSLDYIVYGILGAGMVPVALLASNSKVLDFKADIDYLLFAGFCLVGALFSKSWIKGLVDNLKKTT
jgi:hypothetical protein